MKLELHALRLTVVSRSHRSAVAVRLALETLGELFPRFVFAYGVSQFSAFLASEDVPGVDFQRKRQTRLRARMMRVQS